MSYKHDQCTLKHRKFIPSSTYVDKENFLLDCQNQELNMEIGDEYGLPSEISANTSAVLYNWDSWI